MLDFKDIPKANEGGGQQDTFEQFARDFLVEYGFKIEQHPDRGPDGKKDLIVSEVRTGVSGKETKFLWLVSCKHKAHSGQSVIDTDEFDPKGRVDQHRCNGFLAFYSTIPSSPLNNKLNSIKEHGIEYDLFDDKRIENYLLKSSQRLPLIIQYFTNSYVKHKDLLVEGTTHSVQEPKTQNDFKNNANSEDNEFDDKTYTTRLTEEDLLRITKTAIVLIDIEKIKDEYFNSEKQWNKAALGKLYKYSDHTNERIATDIFSFLNNVAEQTRARMPSSIASSIHTLVLTFFPSSYERKEKERIENGKQCIYIGFNLAYDAFIYLNNFRIAEYGLSILKFIYRHSKRNGMDDLVQRVLTTYSELEQTLNRPERNDLGNAKELVKIFKDDLDTWDLSFPVLPDHLYKQIQTDDEK